MMQTHHQAVTAKNTIMTDDFLVFDRAVIRQKKQRCAAHLGEHGFLFDWALKQMIERLDVIKKDFPLTLQIGNKASLKNSKLKNIITLDSAPKLIPNIIADEELLPFKTDSFDLIISPLTLHSTNDLPGALLQIKNILKPDGLFIGTLFGGETLYELRQTMNEVEMQITGGITPRIAPFADLPQMGALMQRAGFNLPVIDSEKITVTYDNIFKLMEDLRLMGESNSVIERKKTFTSRTFFQKVNGRYAEKFKMDDGRIKASFEIIFLLGWKPHESQQKPLRPGSAKNNLADALKTTERKLPC